MIQQVLNHSDTPLSVLDRRLKAVAHPGRRVMLGAALVGEQSASELAKTAGLSRPAASQHLSILLEAGLLQVRSQGRNRWYLTDPKALDSMRAELSSFWQPRLDALRKAVEA